MNDKPSLNQRLSDLPLWRLLVALDDADAHGRPGLSNRPCPGSRHSGAVGSRPVIRQEAAPMQRLTPAADNPATNGTDPAPAEHGTLAPLVYDSSDLCQVLRISLATLHRLRSAGRLPRALRLGGQLRWDAAEVAAWVRSGMPDLRTWEMLSGAEKTDGRPR